MLAITILAYVLAFCYVFIQGRFYWNWLEFLQEKERKKVNVEPAKWTVIVPTRNEAKSILQTLFKLKGQGAEVIVVNDHSTDNTAALVATQPEVILLNLPEGKAGKKSALSYAISKASGDWIATLDADVSVQQGWLDALNKARSAGTVSVAGPVMLAPYNTWFERWQALDFCGMMAITAASLRIGQFAMGNGANLAFSKQAFASVGGYESPSNEDSVSGDDMVLLGKLLKAYPGKIAFAKTRHAVVSTPPMSEVSSFVQQRWRWTAKTGLNQQPSLTITLGLVWAFHVGLIVGVPLVLFGMMNPTALAMAWGCKLVLDLVLLGAASRHFERKELIDWTYPFQSVVHALYVAGIGTLSLLPFEFEWKGRSARR